MFMVKPNFFSNSQINLEAIAKEAKDYLERLFPICRSITGNGVRQTFNILKEIVDFDIIEIPTGKICYDWIVPQEWNIEDGYIAELNGNKIVDFKDNNLHVVNYSIPVDKQASFQELAKHLHTLPENPDAIPYRTSYYKRDWGFCLSYKQFNQLDKTSYYKVVIESSLKDGSLTIGESIIKGQSECEYLFSTYCCHPSMANDNLSGQVLWAFLLRELKNIELYHSYRFVILPETIGSIAYLSENESEMKNVTGGYVLTTVAGPGEFGYKVSFQEDAEIDRVVLSTFKDRNIKVIRYPFDINGSDERQYSSPAFRIPIGSICKDKYYEYDYYHTSLDDLSFISVESLVKVLELYLLTINKLEINRFYKTNCAHCEPQLGRRGLYPKTGGQIKQRSFDYDKNHRDRFYGHNDSDNNNKGIDLDAINWLIFYCDGKTSLLDISEKTNIPIDKLYETAERLIEYNLLKLN